METIYIYFEAKIKLFPIHITTAIIILPHNTNKNKAQLPSFKCYLNTDGDYLKYNVMII